LVEDSKGRTRQLLPAIFSVVNYIARQAGTLLVKQGEYRTYGQYTYGQQGPRNTIGNINKAHTYMHVKVFCFTGWSRVDFCIQSN